MIRTLHAGRFNEMANEPEVRAWLGGRGPIDLTDTVANPENFAFLTDDENGGYIYNKVGLGLYAVHTISVPAGRNRHMLAARTASLRELFIRSDAVEIVTLVPTGNKGADIWAQHAGFREVFTRAKAFDLMGEMVDVSYRSLGYLDWCIRDRSNREEGAAFHRAIHAVTPDDHGDDPVHDAVVGATLEGCVNGNIEKALLYFNRWASHAGYQQVRLVTARPLVVDIGSCVIQYGIDGLQVLHVRHGRSPPTVEDVIGEPECPSPPLPQVQA